MTPKVSVIMPMFNNEKLVGLALGSLLNQTFTDFEVIVIDDASTDRSLEVVRSFNDPRVKIIENKKNIGGEQGPGIVRNAGLAVAKGEYLYFVDADDAILPNGLELLVNAIESTRADAVICTAGFWAADNDFTTLENIQLIPRGGRETGWVESNLKLRIFREYCDRKLPASTYYHLYRRKLLTDNGIKFKNAIIHEDGIFNLEVYCATKNMIKINAPFYIYRRQKGSVTRPKEMNFTSFAKRVRSYLIVVESFEEILSRALKREYGSTDHFFIDTVCLSIGKQAILPPMGNFYVADSVKCWEIVDAELRKRYGKNIGLLRKMMTGYFMSELAYQTLDFESGHMKKTLKAVKDTVNQLITD